MLGFEVIALVLAFTSHGGAQVFGIIGAFMGGLCGGGFFVAFLLEDLKSPETVVYEELRSCTETHARSSSQ